MQSASSRTKLQINADRRAAESLRARGIEFRRYREDAGLSKAAVARAAGIDPTHLRLIEDGERDASSIVLARVAAALGAEVSTKLFPSGRPPIRDRFQAPMLEAFLHELPARWATSVEVAVHRPVRGFIDAVVGDPEAARVVTIEAHSEIRRLEQQIRWAIAKSDALPSSPVWPLFAHDMAAPPAISRILLLRSTVATREVANAFADTLAAAYPADPADLRRAIHDPDVPWAWVRDHLGAARGQPGDDPPRTAPRVGDQGDP
jgi:transcriptional regulator with XRE-family HTH domain